MIFFPESVKRTIFFSDLSSSLLDNVTPIFFPPRKFDLFSKNLKHTKKNKNNDLNHMVHRERGFGGELFQEIH